MGIIAIIRLLPGQCKEKRDGKEIKKRVCCISWALFFQIDERGKFVRKYQDFF